MIIKNAYGYNFKTAENVADTFTMVPHFFNEFNDRTDIVYILMADALHAEPTRIADVINSYPQNYTIIFDYLYEGFTETAYDKIYKVAKLVPNLEERCYYINGSTNNQTMHLQYCRKIGITKPIKTLSCSTWESYAQHQAITNTVTTDLPKEYRPGRREKLFLNMNRVLRVHRLVLVSLLAEANLLERGYVSFFPDGSHNGVSGFKFIYRGLPNFLGNTEGIRIQQIYDRHQDKFPLKLTIESEENAIYIKPEDIALFEDSYLSLVTETFFYDFKKWPNLTEENAVFFSEKTFKPIQMFHPFILVSRPNSLSWLKRLGYQTFHPLIDETYDTIEDNNERMRAIIGELERLSTYTDDQFFEWQKNIKPIVEHNYKILTEKKMSDYAIRTN